MTRRLNPQESEPFRFVSAGFPLPMIETREPREHLTDDITISVGVLGSVAPPLRLSSSTYRRFSDQIYDKCASGLAVEPQAGHRIPQPGEVALRAYFGYTEK